MSLPPLVLSIAPMAQATPQQPGGNPLMQSLLFIGVMFAILYFLMIRPQRKRQREHMDMMAALRKGDKVITRGGIHGVVTLVRDREVKVKADTNCELTLSKSAIAAVVTQGSDATATDKEDDKS